jgi:phage shock protein A
MRLKRLVATVSAGFEDFVAKVENHEAVADCIIDEVRQAAARVRVQHARARSRILRLEREGDELIAERSRWNGRAVSLAASDETRALECVRRGRRAENRLGAVEAQLVVERFGRTLGRQARARWADFSRGS